MLGHIFKRIFGTKNDRELKRLQPIVDTINSLEPIISKLTDEQLKSKTQEFKQKLNEGQTLNDLLPEAFAVVREASVRTIGLKHFDVQLVGGVVLHEGKIAEMRTGEGKTLVATLVVYLNSLNGKGVHVVTVNDYLSKRDSEWMGPIYNFLGLSVGSIQHGMELPEKKKNYLCDVTYVTNNEIGFDYLRDNMVVQKEDKVLRELNYAIVDEVDSILIDEARTPLIISGPAEQSTDKYKIIDRIVPHLKGKFVTEEEEIDAKHNNIDLSKGFDYLVDEKSSNITLTADGVQKCERILKVDNLYDDIQSEWVHHITQALRAHNLFKKDVDYVIKDGEVVIVDEFTGRLMPGRRWSEGLHQAVEAKEKVTVAQENQTLATITFQNFFKMYNKLAGMTGTALTEADEFFEIYKLDVIEVPTNKPMIRADVPDMVYRTEKEKFNAIVESILDLHKKGSPVLVGTRSIEKSEKLSLMLRKKGVPHRVLNAKYHEMEAQIIAQAGRYGSVTLATNMAGRGTDIVLGGSPQVKEEAKKVIDLGGLHIVGTERHDSRRIDNQLRGRAGRQGDPGFSVFYLSLEDDIMRLFGATDTMSSFMQKLGMSEGQNLQHPWISKAIESAQRKVEGMNFDIRKQLLNYDNVMNKQREVTYSERSTILEKDNLQEEVYSVISEVAESMLETFIPPKTHAEHWDIMGLNNWVKKITDSEIEGIENCTVFEEVKDKLLDTLKKAYKSKEQEIGEQHIRSLEKFVMLQVLDTCWKEHLYNLDQVKKGIGFRAYAQKDPKIEYQQESYRLFMNMVTRLKQETVEYLFKANIVQRMTRPRIHVKEVKEAAKISPKKTDKMLTKTKIGRNDPCPCGSGRKYKKCCGK